jgi:hypothetical protein
MIKKVATMCVTLVLLTVFIAGCTSSNTPTATPTVQGAQATHLTLASSNSTPAKNQSYTLSGYLNDSNNTGVGNQPINIYYHYAGETNWTFWKTANTSTTGKFSLTDQVTKTAYYKAAFPGDSSYAASSAEVTVTIK